jgi:Rrf2 family protein
VTDSIGGSEITVAAGATLMLGAKSIVPNIPETFVSTSVTVNVAPDLTVNGTVPITAPAAGSGMNVNYVNVLNLASTGKITVAPGAHFADHSLVDVLSFNQAAGSLIDLGGDLLFQHVTSDTIAAELKTGFNAGAGYWNGTGIISSAAAVDTRLQGERTPSVEVGIANPVGQLTVHLSAKADYALRVLVHMAEAYKGPETLPLSIRTLAERNDIPKRFLEQIMIELRHCGWVRSIAGRDGGFALALSPEQITMGQVVRHFEGYVAPIACVAVVNYIPCSQEATCRFRRVLLEVRDFTAARLDKATLAELLKERPVRHEEVDDGEFIDGGGI